MLSPANGGVLPSDNVTLNGFASSPIGRVLPSARELAECHGEEELKRLKGLATSLGDTEAVALFEAAQKEFKRLEITRAFERPAAWRAAEAERKAMYAHYQQAKLAMIDDVSKQPVGIAIHPRQDDFLVRPIGAGVAQSAGPSE